MRRGIFGRAHRERRIHTLDVCGCGLTASSLCLRLFYFAEQTKSRTWVWIDDRLPDIWAGPGGGWTNIGRPCVFQSWLILAGVQGHPLPAETVNPI